MKIEITQNELCTILTRLIGIEITEVTIDNSVPYVPRKEVSDKEVLTDNSFEPDVEAEEVDDGFKALKEQARSMGISMKGIRKKETLQERVNEALAQQTELDLDVEEEELEKEHEKEEWTPDTGEAIDNDDDDAPVDELEEEEEEETPPPLPTKSKAKPKRKRLFD